MRAALTLLTLVLAATPLQPALAEPSRAEVIFHYPYPWDRSYAIRQGPGGKFSHQKGQPTEHAYDFAIPEGGPVAAAAEGEVVVAYDQSTVGTCSFKLWPQANRLVIRHADGTDTLYLHLAPGSIRKRSGHVESGEVIATAGHTGFTCNGEGSGPGAHLHIQRQRGSTSATWFRRSERLAFVGLQARPVAPPFGPPFASVAATITLGIFPKALAITPDGRRVYVIGKSSSARGVMHAVLAIDTVTETIVATIPLTDAVIAALPSNSSAEPSHVAVAPDGSHAYVTFDIHSQDLARVFVIDTVTNKVTAIVPLHAYSSDAIAVTPDGSRIYVGSGDGAWVWIIDAPTNKVLGGFEPPGHPSDLAIARDGSRIFIASFEENHVSVLTRGTPSERAREAPTIGIERPSRLAVAPSGAQIYVISRLNNTLSVIDAAANRITATIPIWSPEDLAITSDGSTLYVVHGDGPCCRGGFGGFVSAIATATSQVVGTTSVEGEHLAIAPDGRRGYLLDAGSRATRNPRFSGPSVAVLTLR